MNCAFCGEPIIDRYFTSRDKSLIFGFFDDAEYDNVFCSKECFCSAMSLIEVHVTDFCDDEYEATFEEIPDEVLGDADWNPETENELRKALLLRLLDATKAVLSWRLSVF